MKKLLYRTILLIFITVSASGQTDSLSWLELTISQRVAKEVMLVKPTDYFIADANFMLEGYQSDDDNEFYRRRDELIAMETDERKSQIIADYGGLYDELNIYAGLPHGIMSMFRTDGKEDELAWRKAKDHDRSAVVVLSHSGYYIVCIYNFPKRDKWKGLKDATD